LKFNFIIIHPYDRSTFFLNKIKSFLISKFPNNIHCLNIKPSEDSHNYCLHCVSNLDNGSLILFLGHGHTDKLFGAKSDSFNRINYNNDNFINESNIDIFNEKKVICFSCNSREKIAKVAVDKGATVFLGFGDIPSSHNEFNERGYFVGKKAINDIKGILNNIIKYGIYYSLKNNYSFEQLANIIKLITNKKISELLIIKKKKMKKNKLRNLILAEILFHFKNEITICGDKNIKLID
jgi:hypothetical protein